MSVRLPVLVVVAAATAVATSVASCAATNPFDPDAPSSLQAPGSVRGVIQAVTSPIDPDSGDACAVDGGGPAPVCNFADTAATPCCVPEPSFCGPVAGDHSGFNLVLRGLSADDAESAIRSQSAQTNESGAFVFQNVPPGTYSLEVVRDGFALPVPRNVELIPGDNLDVGTLCGVNAADPNRPVLDTLPPSVRVVTGAAAATLPSVRILGCAAGLHYSVVQSLKDGVTHETIVDGAAAADPDGVCTVAATVAPAPGVSDVWHIEARAVDALLNTSDATAADVVLDATPPRVPCDVTAQAAEDRVIVSWGILADVDDDGDGVVDGTVCQRESALDVARWIVSYTLSERPAGACPASVAGDDFDIAAFAVEGPSPVVAAAPSLTLSGILPGTELFVQVASVDDVGNPSCFSDPVRTRPDLVTPALVDGPGLAAVSGVLASSTNDGVTAWAQGGGGLAVRGVDGSIVSFDALPSTDVVVSGTTVFGAGGALGVHVLPLDDSGVAAGSPGAIDGDDVRALAAVPGGLVLGTSTGVRVIDLGDPSSSPPAGLAGAPVVKLDVHSGLIAAARDDQTLSLALLANPGSALASVPLSGPTSALRIIDDEVWVAGGNTIDVVPVGACPAAPCPGAVVRFQLPTNVRAVDVAAWDDLVLVLGSVDDAGNADPGGVFLYDGNGASPRLVGRGFPPAGATDLTSLAPGAGGFCADGTIAGAAQEICWRTVSFPLVATSTPLVNAASVKDAQPVGAFAWTRGQSAGAESLSLWRFADGGELARESVPDDAALLSVLAVPGGLFAVDTQARLLFAPESDRGVGHTMRVVDDTILATEIADVFADAGVDVFPLGTALLAQDGPDLVVAVHLLAAGECRPAALVRLDLGLSAAAQNQPRVASAASVLLAGTAERVSAVDVAGGVARIGEKPFAVVAVDTETMTEDATASIAPAAAACTGGQGSELQSLARLGAGRGRLLASGIVDRAGALVNGVFDVDAGGATVVSDATSSFKALGGSGAFIAVVTNDTTVLLDGDGPALDSLRPVLTFPNAAQVASVAASGRGLLFGAGPSGALAVTLR